LTLDALFALNPTLGLNTLLLPGRGVIVGRVPVPSQVGGSTDQASPEPTASITPTPRPSETPPAQPSPSAAVATSALGTQAPGKASENTGIDAAGLPRLVAIFGVGIGLLAAVGVALVWLSRPR
jgi:hypothetical protein